MTIPFAFPTLLVLALMHRPASVCSKGPNLSFRSPEAVYFIGSGLPDTVAVTPGTVPVRSGGGHFGAARFRVPYGQVVQIDRLASSSEESLPPGTTKVILVPWDYNASCQPVYWGASARWLPPGARGLLDAELRDPAHWVGSMPTLDVFAPELTPYPWASGYQRELSFDRAEAGPQDTILTADELLELIDVLPTVDRADVWSDSALAPLLAWARANPRLANRWPASNTVFWLRRHAEDERVRSRASPLAGTYRVVVVFGSGDSSVVYARTERSPMSTVRSRRRDGEGDDSIVGYYLMSQYAASARDLPLDDRRRNTSYHAVSLLPVLESRDSSVWRGSVNPLVEVTFLDPRPAVRVQARALFGAGDEGRDSLWYYFPGKWITYPDGHARFEWKAGVGRDTYFVRAERISLETTPGHSR